LTFSIDIQRPEETFSFFLKPAKVGNSSVIIGEQEEHRLEPFNR
jgi:hypothetical protein